MVKVKGSKDGDILKARFEGSSKSLFPNLNKTKSLVLLSIQGNQYCTGEYLKAIVEKATSDFEFTTFLIADEVYWHNLCQNSNKDVDDEVTLKEKAVTLGKTYFEEHLDCFLYPSEFNSEEFDLHLIEKFPLDKQAALNKTAKNYEVLFWRDWLNKSKEYSNIQPQIAALFKSESILADSVHRVASDFARRHSNKSMPNESLMHYSSNYLIEESPAVMWIAASLGYNFIIYPGEMIASFSASRDYFIKKETDKNLLFVNAREPKLLVNWLEVSFVRSRSSDSNTNIKNKNSAHTDQNELTQLMKGVTEGICSLPLDKKEKIELITDIILAYQQKKAIIGSDENRSLPLDADIAFKVKTLIAE